jgi:hypothetical protein
MLRTTTKVLAAGLIVCLAGTVLAEKKRDWQMGKITHMETTADNAQSNTRQTLLYKIEGETTLYTIAMPKPDKIPLRPHTTVKFAIEKGAAYVVGDDGKELEFSVVRAVPLRPARN